MGDEVHHIITAAAERGRDVARDQPLAKAAHYDAAAGQLVIGLTNGSHASLPCALIETLADATDAERADVEITGIGYGLYWPALDLDLAVPALLADVLGTAKWVSRQRAAQAGAASTPAKSAAARQNGAKGGRPRKVAP